MNESLHAFTSAYPRNGNETDTFREWLIVLRYFTAEQMIEGAKRWAEHWIREKTPTQFIPFAAKFLHTRQFLEFPSSKPKFKDLPADSDYRWTANRQNDPINSRPLMWWTKRRELWSPDWLESEIPAKYR